jgi:hypothetical protein
MGNLGATTSTKGSNDIPTAPCAELDRSKKLAVRESVEKRVETAREHASRGWTYARGGSGLAEGFGLGDRACE